MKFAYAAREHLGDMDFVHHALALALNFTSDEFARAAARRITANAHTNDSYYYFMNENNAAAAVEDHGTAHISVLDQEGNAVSVTSTINLYFGSMKRSTSTDIIWNDDMDDFSTPGSDNSFNFAPSPYNYIEPGKRPLSSMTPLIFYDDRSGDVQIVAGAAGGSRIISATANVVARLLWFGQTPKEAIDSPRLHNQLHPFNTEFEKGFPRYYVDQLIAKDQNLTLATGDDASSSAITRDKDFIYANSDYRKIGGYPAGF